MTSPFFNLKARKVTLSLMLGYLAVSILFRAVNYFGEIPLELYTYIWNVLDDMGTILGAVALVHFIGSFASQPDKDEAHEVWVDKDGNVYDRPE